MTIESQAPRGKIGGFARRLACTWFEADPRALGLFRIAFGLLGMVDVIRRIPWIETFYSNTGTLSNHYNLYSPMFRENTSLLSAFFTCAATPAATFFFRTTLPLGIAARAATEARGAQCHLDRDRDGESGDETPRGSVHERRDRISATNRHIFRTFVCVVF